VNLTQAGALFSMEASLMQIDPRERGKLHPVKPPVPFQSKDSRLKGWKVTLPGERPLATPAVVDGNLFLGGGFGTYEFYVLDAITGRLAWQYQTTDDGPTAAVVWDRYVAFNTESCELEVLRSDGRALWKRWLGDPLMSMPAIGQGRVYAAFPDSRGDHRNYLAAFDVRSGQEAWRSCIDAEVITAPVLADGCIFLTNLQGDLFCFRQEDGSRLWREPKGATSSPTVWHRECFFTRRREEAKTPDGKRQKCQTEHVAARGVEPLSDTRTYEATIRMANYLDHSKRLKGSPRYAGAAAYDAGVGFAAHKGDAKIHLAMKHLGRGHVQEIWAYQGSRPFIYRGHLYSALGHTVYCVDPVTQEVCWQKRLGPEMPSADELDNALTPPATANGKLFLGSIFGEVYCLSATSGDELWRVRVDQAIAFQPAVARGRVYVPTDAGTLYCLETGDERDDGWYMWGATAAHNGLVD
jgi:outer membrane protein assembly factor BamB